MLEFSKYVPAIEIQSALVSSTIGTEAESSSLPSLDHVGTCSEMLVVSDEDLQIAQISMALLNS